MTRRLGLLFSICLCLRAEDGGYELRGRLVPPTRASVWLHGATTPFEENTLADDDGHFRFHNLAAGAYTAGIFVPGQGELRRTIEIGPSQANSRKRIELAIELHDADFESRDPARRAALVSAKELSIPDQARHEYEEAEKRLAKRDSEGAVAHFEHATRIAPQFAAAWNHLGTIAYQSHQFPRAENCFRKALAADKDFFQAQINLGGVLINLNQFEEALQYNLYAALTHPNDALANSQLGITYFYLNKLDLGEKYLKTAERIDPAHFSHPQLILAQIDLRRHDHAAAAQELEAFLQYHPDAPQAAQVKDDVARLRAGPPQEFAKSRMANSFSDKPDAPPPGEKADAVMGSGHHLRIFLKHAGDSWTALPQAWFAEGAGRFAGNPGLTASSACFACHASQTADHTGAITCRNCHGASGSGQSVPTACVRCHVDAGGPNSVHGETSGGEEPFELNSAAYRLAQSRCYLNSAGKLTCITCHPPHTFQKTAEGYRAVCRGCHATMHNSAALDCRRCHMPQRRSQDAGHVLVTDHRIQRPL